MSKDRARPFSRKHRQYWIPVTGGMILLGIINVIIGYVSYTRPSDTHERIRLDVPNARGASDAAVPNAVPTGCPPAVLVRIEADMPGSAITECSPGHVTLVRTEQTIELEIEGDTIRAIAEHLTLPQIPAVVMRAFAVTYPKTIPAGAIKRTRRGEPAIYELAFPPNAAFKLVRFRADGTIIETL